MATVTECAVCKHLVRPYRTKATDFPGTRKKVGAKCSLCHRNPLNLSDEGLFQRERAKNSSTCLSCKKPMRPAGSLSGGFPGTVEKATHGKCNSCYKRGDYKGRSFVEDTDIVKLDALPAPVVTPDDYRIVRRLIQERFDGDDYLLSTLGLEGDDL